MTYSNMSESEINKIAYFNEELTAIIKRIRNAREGGRLGVQMPLGETIDFFINWETTTAELKQKGF